MAEFSIKIADHIWGISTIYDSTQDFCKEYLTQETPSSTIAVTPDDIDSERTAFLKESVINGKQINSLSDAQLELGALQRKVTESLITSDHLLFHGSVVAVDNQAYLFTAKSGTGKSTHTRLWREVFGERAMMINDDKPFLQITENGVLAWGSPWNGKHRLGTNTSVPLKAICILERSETNWIKPIPVRDALKTLFQQSQRPQDPAQLPHYMELIEKLATGVELFRLGCNMDPEAALVSYEAMSRGRKENLR